MAEVQLEKNEQKLLVVGLGRSKLSPEQRQKIATKPLKEMEIKTAIHATSLPDWANGILINLEKASAAAEHLEDLAQQAQVPCEVAMTLDATIDFIAKLPDIETESTGGKKGMKLIEGVEKFADFNATFGQQEAKLLKALSEAGIETTPHSAEQCFYKVRARVGKKRGRNPKQTKKMPTKSKRGRAVKIDKHVNGAIDLKAFQNAVNVIVKTAQQIVRHQQEAEEKLAAARKALQ